MLNVPNNYAIAKLVFELIDSSGHTATITYGVEKGAAGNAQTLAINLMAAAVQSDSIGSGPAMSSLWKLAKSQVSLKTASGFEFGELIDPSPGTQSWAPPPLQVAPLIRKSTGTGGRKNRGRMFFPPAHIDEADINELGVWDDTARGIFADRTDFWLDYLNSTLNIDMVIFHNDGVTAPTAVTSLIVEHTVATQRRRLRR